MTYIDKTKLPKYRALANELYTTSDGTIAVEGILAKLANEGHDVHIGDISGHGWLEIDNEEELIAANRAIKSDPSAYIEISTQESFTQTPVVDTMRTLA